MDRETARTLVSLKVEDPDQTQFNATQYNRAIDLAEEQFAIDTRAIRKETTLTTVADTTEISLPTDTIVLTDVRHKGINLRKTTRHELNSSTSEDWTTIKGTPTSYYVDTEDETLGLFPKPQTADAGANLIVNYAAFPATISSDSTVLLNARALLALYHPAIVAWAAREVLSYMTATPEIEIKRQSLIKDYEVYKSEAISTYDNMANAPIRMSGGRNWQQKPLSSKPNAFT